MKNKLVIFDCFGVIFDEIAPVFFRRHFDEETAKTLKDKYFIPADLGEITREELFDRMSAELGMKKEDILSEWNELIRLRPYMVKEIEKIREKADVALLSNAPLGFVEKIFAENGITLAGGCSQIYGMDRILSERTGIPCTLADDADSCVAYGCGKSLSWINHMQEGPINIARKRILRNF